MLKNKIKDIFKKKVTEKDNLTVKKKKKKKKILYLLVKIMDA